MAITHWTNNSYDYRLTETYTRLQKQRWDVWDVLLTWCVCSNYDRHCGVIVMYHLILLRTTTRGTHQKYQVAVPVCTFCKNKTSPFCFFYRGEKSILTEGWLLILVLNFRWTCMVFTLIEIKTDKNGWHRIVWRCSYCTETAMPLGTVATVSVSVSNSMNAPLIACVLMCLWSC